jgi:tetratricopeptide (TPR) repeat protein
VREGGGQIVAASGPGGPRRRFVGWRKWVLRIVLALAAPAMVFGLFEGGLRLAGYGYPTGFFVTADGGRTWTGNEQFAWRYSPPAVASLPDLFLLPGAKAPGTVRIFILGESAAMGTPDPSYSFGRVLEVMLRERHPAVRFEVINAAVMGISSHAVRDIARDCAAHEPDLFIVYMGNNEIIGPWSPFTAPPALASNLPVVRTALWAKTTKVGQWVGATARKLGAGRDEAEPQTLEFFIEKAIAPGDPGLQAVYDHFAANLRDICRAGRRAGAKVLVSTVAVNLKDCAPLASRHRIDLAEAAQAEWERLFAAGNAEETGGLAARAAGLYQDALKIDDRYADLHFRLGWCLRALGRNEEAAAHCRLACDLDAMPFRTVSPLNAAVRAVAAGREDEGIGFVDGAGALAAAGNPPGLPGEESFYEHVHMTFEGNCRMAQALLSAVEKALPALSGAAGPAAAPQRAAEALALTEWDRLRLAEMIAVMTARPPFTNQSDHVWREDRRRRALVEIQKRDSPAAREAATRTYLAAIERSPGDWRLHDNFAALRFVCGDCAAAAEHWQIVQKTFPCQPAVRLRISEALARQGKAQETVACNREILALKPDCTQAHMNLGNAFVVLDRLDDAVGQFSRAYEIQPDPRECAYVGQLLAGKGRLEEAIAWYRRGLDRKRDDLGLHAGLGLLLADHGRPAEAEPHLRAVLGTEPDHVQVRCALAAALARQGKCREADAQYRLVLALNPRLPRALAGLAWLLATDAGLRNAEEAVTLAEQACRETRNEAPDPLDSLAAAYAEMGRFGDAVRAADLALSLAAAAGNKPLADDIRKRLELYKAGKPYRLP